MSEETIPPATPAPITPDQGVIKSAAEAVAQSHAARSTYEQKTRELEAELAAIKAQLSAPSSPAPELDEFKRYVARERQSARVSAVRRMGLDVALSDEQLLAIVPDVDPREPDGLAKLEAWRTANTRMFRASGPTPESVIEAVKVTTVDLQKKAGPMFQLDKAIASIIGGGGR